MHEYTLMKNEGGVRTWVCEECGRMVVEGHGQPKTVIKTGDEGVEHAAIDSGLSPLWLEAIRGLFS